MNNYEINYNQMGGTIFICESENCNFSTGNLPWLEAERILKDHYSECGHGGTTISCDDCKFTTGNVIGLKEAERILDAHHLDCGHGDISSNRFPFAKSCQLFVKLQLNHLGMQSRLIQIRRKANLEGIFNSTENDKKIDYHVTLLQIYINTQHPKFQLLLTNKDQICNKINNNFIKAFRGDSFIPGALEKFGRYLVQNLSINDKTFNKYVNAKRDFYTYLNDLFGWPTSSVDSQYSPRAGVIIDGKRFFVDNKPFYWIPEFYLTPDIGGTPKNNFMPHISVLNISQHGQPITVKDIAGYSDNVVIPNPITIDVEFNIKSSISYHKIIDPNHKIIHPNDCDESDTCEIDGEFIILVNIKTHFIKNNSYIISLIRGCNT